MYSDDVAQTGRNLGNGLASSYFSWIYRPNCLKTALCNTQHVKGSVRAGLDWSSFGIGQILQRPFHAFQGSVATDLHQSDGPVHRRDFPHAQPLAHPLPSHRRPPAQPPGHSRRRGESVTRWRPAAPRAGRLESPWPPLARSCRASLRTLRPCRSLFAMTLTPPPDLELVYASSNRLSPGLPSAF